MPTSTTSIGWELPRDSEYRLERRVSSFSLSLSLSLPPHIRRHLILCLCTMGARTQLPATYKTNIKGNTYPRRFTRHGRMRTYRGSSKHLSVSVLFFNPHAAPPTHQLRTQHHQHTNTPTHQHRRKRTANFLFSRSSVILFGHFCLFVCIPWEGGGGSFWWVNVDTSTSHHYDSPL